MASDTENRLSRALRESALLLEKLNQPYALVGGLAISSRSEPRFTRDIDLSVAAGNDTDAEKLIFTLQQQGYRILATVEQEAAGRLATVRLRVPLEPEGIVLDLLFASCGIEPEIVAAAERLEVFPALVVPVARIDHLIAMKVLARDDRRRPQDAIDLRALLRAASPLDLLDAREALRLIHRRGYDRGKALEQELDDALLELG